MRFFPRFVLILKRSQGVGNKTGLGHTSVRVGSYYSNYTSARKDWHVLLSGGDDTLDPSGNPSQYVDTGRDGGDCP